MRGMRGILKMKHAAIHCKIIRWKRREPLPARASKLATFARYYERQYAARQRCVMRTLLWRSITCQTKKTRFGRSS